MTHCLVTGGRGFIGAHLMDALIRRGHTAESYDKQDGGDVLSFGHLWERIAECDIVFDCAGILGSAETFGCVHEAIEVNVFGTLNALEGCKRHGKPMVYLSLKNEWHNPYMISKRAGTELCQMYAEYYGLNVSVVRGLNAYGPGQHWGKVRKVIPTFIVNALRNEPLRLFGDGRQIIDLIYVRDLCEIMLRLWERSVWGVALDGGTGVPLQVRDVAQLVIDTTGSTSAIEYEPMRIGEPDRAVALADPTDARRLLDYYPETRLCDGMAHTIAWYREHWQEAER